MRRKLLALALLLGTAASADDSLFGSGKPPMFREEDADRRFSKSKLARALVQGTDDPGCVQLLGGLLMVVGESAPYLHKRDENLFIDQTLWASTGAHLSTQRFPAQQYLVLMMRRVLIDGKLPDEWYATAEKVNGSVKFIDLAKLKYLQDGVKPVDSYAFTLPELRHRYEMEVLRANSVAATAAEASFRDSYLDRDVIWGGLTLIDVGPEKKPAAKKGKKKSAEPEEPPELIANLVWTPPDPNAGDRLAMFAPKKGPPPIKIVARLSPEQYVDVTKFPRGSRVMIRGRFWEMDKTISKLEVREGLLFQDRDYSAGVVLADPNAVARCPVAVDEISGLAPQQPGGFKH